MLRSLELFQDAQRAFKDEVHRLYSSRAQSAALPQRSSSARSLRPPKPSKRPETAPAKGKASSQGGQAIGSFRVQQIPRTSSPFLNARILRTRERQIEELCSFGGPGLFPDTNGRIYAQKLLSGEAAADLDLAALISAWLAEPLRAPWHFHLSRANGYLYFVHDTLGVAISEHPDEHAMRRLIEFSSKVQEFPTQGVRLLHAEISDIDVRAQKQLNFIDQTRPDFEGWLEGDNEGEYDGNGGVCNAETIEAGRNEIRQQRDVLVKNLKQYVSRIGVPRVSFKTVAFEKNSSQRKLTKSKQAIDSAGWLHRKYEDKRMGSVLEKIHVSDSLAESVNSIFKRSNASNDQKLTCPLFSE